MIAVEQLPPMVPHSLATTTIPRVGLLCSTGEPRRVFTTHFEMAKGESRVEILPFYDSWPHKPVRLVNSVKTLEARQLGKGAWDLHLTAAGESEGRRYDYDVMYRNRLDEPATEARHALRVVEDGVVRETNCVPLPKAPAAAKEKAQ